ncbi:MAG: alpha/beta hydrolase [Bacteroidetes bacterium]|nr:alpha/beta hydrolase [Bacteroidota bacterium]
MPPRTYLLPGIGCDHRLFERLTLDGLDVVMLDWPDFPKGCTLAGIARAMHAQVDTTRPHVLVGVSMGGMVAQELALLTRPERVVLISSWTGPQEWPPFVRLNARLRPLWTINRFSLWATWPFKRMLGRRDRAIDRLLYHMAVEQTAAKIRRGVGAILAWPGSRWTGPIARIHGDRDLVIPLRFPVDHRIAGGTHIMVITRAAEVSRALRTILVPDPAR